MLTAAFVLGAGLSASGCGIPQPSMPQGIFPRSMPAIPPADAAAARVPPGYRVEVVVRDLIYPTSVEFDDRGNLYVAEAGYTYGDPVAPPRIPADHVGWRDGVRGRGEHGALGPTSRTSCGTAASSTARDIRLRGETFLTPHGNNVLARQGRLVSLRSNVRYVMASLFNRDRDRSMLARTGAFQPFGVSGNRVVKDQVKANATILRMNPDGSGLEVYAWGIRNPFGVRWGPDARLYASENGYDERGSAPSPTHRTTCR